MRPPKNFLHFALTVQQIIKSIALSYTKYCRTVKIVQNIWHAQSCQRKQGTWPRAPRHTLSPEVASYFNVRWSLVHTKCGLSLPVRQWIVSCYMKNKHTEVKIFWPGHAVAIMALVSLHYRQTTCAWVARAFDSHTAKKRDGNECVSRKNFMGTYISKNWFLRKRKVQ